jgi:hypothetical protein
MYSVLSPRNITRVSTLNVRLCGFRRRAHYGRIQLFVHRFAIADEVIEYVRQPQAGAIQRVEVGAQAGLRAA